MNIFMVGIYSFITTIILTGIMLAYFLYESYRLNQFNYSYYSKGIEKINLTEFIKASGVSCNDDVKNFV